MKAVKIYSITWNNTETTEKENLLPSIIGFKTSDDFNVAGKIPALLEKKFKKPVESFNFSEFHIPNSVDELLVSCSERSDKDKKPFTHSGKLTSYGKMWVSALKGNVLWRERLEKNKTPEDKMPQILDIVRLGLESVTGMSWEKDGSEEMMKIVLRNIRNRYDDEKNFLMEGYED